MGGGVVRQLPEVGLFEKVKSRKSKACPVKLVGRHRRGHRGKMDEKKGPTARNFIIPAWGKGPGQ